MVLRSLTILFTLTLLALGLADRAHAAQVTLGWADNSNNESGFKIERKTGSNGTFVQVAVTGPNVTSHVDGGLTAGTIYCYRVRAYNAAGHSSFTPEACGGVSLASAQLAASAGTMRMAWPWARAAWRAM